jgi:hypothetical protein
MILGAFLAVTTLWTRLWFAILPGVAVFLVGFFSSVVGRYMNWRGGPACQSCGCRNTRAWTDEGRLFSVCEGCHKELMS